MPTVDAETREMLLAFVDESREVIADTEPLLVELEQQADAETVQAIVRMLHSMKGSAGFLGLAHIQGITHDAETLLQLIRDGDLEMDAPRVDVLCHALDLISARPTNVEQTFADEGDEAAAEAVRRVLQAAALLPGPEVASGAPAPMRAVEGAQGPHRAAAGRRGRGPRRGHRGGPRRAEPADPSVRRVVFVPAEPPAPRDAPGGRTQARRPDGPGGRADHRHHRRHPHPAIAELGAEGFDKSAAQLDRITRALQDMAMSLRMTPVAKTFERMSRLVRDIAHKRGRKVQLVIDEEDTEVDKSVAELISDPLVHILRNAVDHGIEGPEERDAAGKPREGTVRLTARHQGGEVWVTVEDEGRGLDKQKIDAKAVEQGLTTKPIHALADREIYGFVFALGFSTVAEVSDISGRGVGMDVARRNLESISGRVDVSSEPGRGTTVTLRIPLTLAIIEGMLVRVGEACFTIPMLQVQESVRVPSSAITVLHTGQEMVRIRNRLLPVLRLHELYGIHDAPQAEPRHPCPHRLNHLEKSPCPSKPKPSTYGRY